MTYENLYEDDSRYFSVYYCDDDVNWIMIDRDIRTFKEAKENVYHNS